MRRLADRAFRAAAALCALAALAVLAGVVGAILVRGLPALDPALLTTGEGGLLFQLLGTLVLVAAALAVALPLATALALVATVYLRSAAARHRLRLAFYTLNGVPSIVFGIVGLVLFVKAFGWGKSWLGGGIVLAFMILPTVTVALIERIEALPREYLEAGSGLGLDRSQLVWSIVLPQSATGLVSGALLGLARAAGETAPIMFTAAVFSGATLPRGIAESPVLALPYHIFVRAQDTFDAGARAELWGAALLLLFLVFGLALAALPARLKLHEEAHRG